MEKGKTVIYLYSELILSSEHKNKGDGRIQFNSIHSRYAHLGIYTKVKEERTERTYK